MRQPLAFTPRRAVLSFLVPVACLIWPYQALRDLDAKIEPADIPEPPPVPAADFHTGYRQAAFERPRVSGALPKPPLVAWWTLWILPIAITLAFRPLVDGPRGWGYSLTTESVHAACAALAFVVIARIDARLREPVRRVAAPSLRERRPHSIRIATGPASGRAPIMATAPFRRGCEWRA